MIAYYADLVANYPIVSIEDPLNEDDWDGWKAITDALGDKTQLVGDDLFVTNVERLAATASRAARPTPLLVKVNQIGSLTETLDSVDLAHRNGYTLHDVATARARPRTPRSPTSRSRRTAARSRPARPARSERVAKYNQLLRIEDELGDAARYAGAAAFPRYQG